MTAVSTAAVFQMNMNAAWQGVFGEANSMFEQLVASWADLLFQRLSESIADAFVTDVLSQIPGLGFLSQL